jgi:beta-glucanase (GH16 family)
MRETEIIKWILGNLCIFIIISFGAGCSSGGGWKLEWSDEFNGSNLSPQKWTIVTGGSGFGNGESQYYTARPKNIHVKDGLLLIRAFKERYGTNFYTSAKITTYKKFSMKYGRIEIRARLPCGRGIWPAFWLLPINGEWPETGEIDIMEEDGLMPETVYGTLHFGLPWTYRTRSFSLDKGSFSDNFHVFTLEWEPGEFRWYVDGYLYSKVNEWFSRRKGKQNYCEYPAPFNTDFYLQINLAVGGHFPGPPDRTTVFPQTLAVDYVRIYRKDYYPSMKLNPEGVRDYFSKPLRGLMPDGNLIFNGNFKLKNIIGWQPYSFIDSGMAAKIAENGYWQFLTGSGGIADFKISNGYSAC